MANTSPPEKALLVLYPDGHRKRKLRLTMEYWTCTVCNIEMQLQSSEPHLSGKRHAAAVKEYQERIPQETRAQEAGKQWTCTVCNIEMHCQRRDPHLSGKRHAAAAEEYLERVLPATRVQEAGKQWTCTICNIEMQMQSRDSHLSGNRHAMAAQSQAYIPAFNNTATSSSTVANILRANPGVGAVTNDTTSATSDIIEVNGASAVLVSQCTTCGYYVQLSLWQSHLSSVGHVRNLVEAIKVTCTAIWNPQLQVSDNYLREKENLEYQDAVLGIKALAPYLANHSSYTEAIPKFPAMHSLPELVAQPNRKSKPETRVPTCPDCRTVLIGDNKTTHSCLYPQPTPVPATGPLDAFFLSFSSYQYDPSIPPAESFSSFRQGLRRWNDWDGYSPDTWKSYKEDVYTRYQAALTKEFNLWFGTEDDIRAWHSLCRAIAIHPLPATPELCREVVRNRHVNIVDLVQWAREREVGQVRIFRTVKELSTYSYKENKIYDKDQIGQGAVLRHLLRHLAGARRL